MKFINPITSDPKAAPGTLAFKHDGLAYYTGETRLVSSELAGYFCGVGWATCEGIETKPPDTSAKKLAVPAAKHATKPSHLE